MSPLDLVPFYVRWIIVVALVGAVWTHGYVKGLNHGEAERERATAAFVSQGVHVVEKFHDRVVTVTAAAPNVRPNLERLCTDWVVRSAGGTHAPSAAAAGNGETLEGVAGEVPSCIVIRDQLNGLQEQLRPQLAPASQ